MGRSQVERNRTRGRPGTKGRGGGQRGHQQVAGGGGGGGGKTRGRGGPPPEGLGSNAWRYESKVREEDSGAATDALDHMLTDAVPGYEEHGPAHHEASAGLGGELEAESWGQGRELDLTALAKVIKGLSTAERLCLPDHIAAEFDARYGIAGGRGARSKTVTELRLETAAPSSSSTNADEGVSGIAPVISASEEVGSHEGDNTYEGGDVDNKSNAGGNDREDGEEDDLDAWLDSVIS